MRKTIVNTEKFITVDIRLVKRAWKVEANMGQQIIKNIIEKV